jgi:hypothetical protein
MKITITYNLSKERIIQILAHHYLDSNDYPKSKQHCIEIIKIHIKRYGNEKIYNLKDKNLEKANIWIKSYFPEL